LGSIKCLPGGLILAQQQQRIDLRHSIVQPPCLGGS
jgi:hypothetical protein